jgi:hypothetical protein
VYFVANLKALSVGLAILYMSVLAGFRVVLEGMGCFLKILAKSSEDQDSILAGIGFPSHQEMLS